SGVPIVGELTVRAGNATTTRLGPTDDLGGRHDDTVRDPCCAVWTGGRRINRAGDHRLASLAIAHQRCVDRLHDHDAGNARLHHVAGHLDRQAPWRHRVHRAVRPDRPEADASSQGFVMAWAEKLASGNYRGGYRRPGSTRKYYVDGTFARKRDAREAA